MAWKKVSPETSGLLERALSGFDSEKKQMFGCPAYFVNSNWFAGAHEENILVRLSESDREDIFSRYDEAHVFEPFEGRKMKEFVVLPESLVHDREEFRVWLDRAYDYARSMPPKEKKPKKKRVKR